MPRDLNPFHTLYVTETARRNPEQFTQLFSPEILHGEVTSLFEPGNTIVQGSIGIGKTMLLTLFMPRIARASLQHGELLKHEGYPRFAVDINFSLAGFSTLGQRPLADSGDENRGLWSAVFGDLFNYYLVERILVNLRDLEGPEDLLAERLGAKITAAKLDEFARTLAKRQCWYDFLKNVESFESLQKAVSKRVAAYRGFLAWNRKRLPPALQRTKTEIGVPLGEIADCLEECGLFEKAGPLVVTVDQTEVLLRVDPQASGNSETSLGVVLCRTVNRALGSRDPRVSYKIASRPYALEQNLQVYGTGAALEQGRDYQLVDLDEIFRRHENEDEWFFKRFAEDVVQRRLRSVGWESLPPRLDELFAGEPSSGTGDSAGRRRRKRAPGPRLQPPGRLPASWSTYLSGLATHDLDDADRAVVWLHQISRRERAMPDFDKYVDEKQEPSSDNLPWRREWWRKERNEVLKFQVASQTQQRRVYAGWRMLLTVSGSSTYILLSILREAFDIFIRDRAGKERGGETPPSVISAATLSQAIRLAAKRALERVAHGPHGDTRHDFLLRLGTALRDALMSDPGISYPGWTGFSLSKAELSEAPDLRRFLEELSGFGDLVHLDHTTKEKDGLPREKWYLAPILCAHFEIPAIRTKEPYYTSAAEVANWRKRRTVIKLRRKDRNDSQSELFPG